MIEVSRGSDVGKRSNNYHLVTFKAAAGLAAFSGGRSENIRATLWIAQSCS
jgi:hypothetical protein